MAIKRVAKVKKGVSKLEKELRKMTYNEMEKYVKYQGYDLEVINVKILKRSRVIELILAENGLEKKLV